MDFIENNPGTTDTFPNGKGVNSSGGGATDGYAYIASSVSVNETAGFFQAVLNRAGMIPNGITEAAGASQVLDGILNIICAQPGLVIKWGYNDDPAVLGMKAALLQGDLLLASAYPKLVANMWVGSGLNATANAFYRTNSDDTVRSDTGTHIKLLDARGLGWKALGNAIVNGRTKFGPVNKWDIQEDRFQAWQLGSSQDTTGPRNYYGIARDRDTAYTITGASLNNTYISLSTTGQSVPWLMKAMNDGVNGDPRTGLNTRDTTVGVEYAILID
jgi:hypothetical protein